MATDFFQRQDDALRQTTRLVVLFSLSVMVIIAAIYLVMAASLSYAVSHPETAKYVELWQHSEAAQGGVPTDTEWTRPGLWKPQLLLGVVGGTLIVIALGSLYKIAELSSGGERVALMLGGRAIDPQTTDLAERRLLNVVEEMALASGVPMPPVFVLDGERGINAFAAGHQPGDAVVAVSAGALRYLDREELQGVMAHEFSHILNGDMRLNLRLIGIVHGILILAIIGYYILRFGGTSRGSRKGNAGAVLVLGLALLILGYLGVLFGKLIKSAISRQREYLADASAVQFTRQSGGIVGALKKIGGLTAGSRIEDAHAAEISHMFFGNALAESFFNVFATHPPLVDRIKALEPGFNGQFPKVARVAGDVQAPGAPVSAFAGPAPPVEALHSAGGMVQRMGQPDTMHLQVASRMIGSMPPALLTAVHEPFSAQSVVLSLLLSRTNEALRAKQRQLLSQKVEGPLCRETERLVQYSVPAAARLPLVDLATAAIKRSSPEQYKRFRQAVSALVEADDKVDLFEYCLRTVLFSYLDVHFGLKRPPAVHRRTMASVREPLATVISALAHAGHKDSKSAQRAFRAGVDRLGRRSLKMREVCTLRDFDTALGELAQSSPSVKREIINAATACIAADDRVTVEEGELLRAVAAVLACPMPPAIV